MSPSERDHISILLLCDNGENHANTVLDHISALKDFSRHDVRLYNPRWVRGSISLDLKEFDAIVIHYSIYILSKYYLSANFKEKLRRFQGLKIQFIQDDYRQIDEFAAAMRELGIQILFTLYPEKQIHKVWSEQRLPGVLKLSTLAGYIPDRLIGLPTPPVESRPIDIGYRGRTIPYWLGELGQEKVLIGQGVLERTKDSGLVFDIAWAEQDRIYGEDWNRFLTSCKATLGTESGASITDFDGSVERRVKQYLKQHPFASFKEVRDKILQPYEGNVTLNVISPRMFEAIVMGTALILFPGDYSGILKPWLHYIPLQKDFFNIDQVLKLVRDMNFLGTLTERAYKEIVVSGQYSFRSFVREFDDVVAKYAKSHSKSFKPRYWLAKLERPVSLSFFRLCGRIAILQWNMLGGPHGELVAALTLILRTPPLRHIFSCCLRNYRGLRGVRLKTLVKELFLLGIIEQAHAGVLATNRPFSVSVQYSREAGSVMITSSNCETNNAVPVQHESEPGCQSDHQSLWSSMYTALQRGQITSMVWDHSAIGGDLSYVQKPFGVCIIIGDHGVRHFSCVTKLTTCSS